MAQNISDPKIENAIENTRSKKCLRPTNTQHSRFYKNLYEQKN